MLVGGDKTTQYRSFVDVSIDNQNKKNVCVPVPSAERGMRGITIVVVG